MDKAGQGYWDRHWEAVTNSAFLPATNLRDRVFAQLLHRMLHGLDAPAVVMEAGCADSIVLPYVGSLGHRIVGVDYSEVGCRKFRSRVPSAQVECCDIFSPPPHVIGSADALFSIGLVEHFTDTSACVRALAALLKPGGRMLTIIPNMHGVVGLTQKLLARDIYDVHVRITPAELARAHAGLNIAECAYVMPMNFGVVNPGRRPIAQRIVKNLARASSAVSRLAPGFPPSRAFSPYVYCLAEVPQSAPI